ncbi:MAG TPA: hypothetical protein VE685_09890, partial [Thermoanaerobaculia bacterium]|nr:hypothetical protein [Thermoanaerobaculia bacterium]
GRACRSGGALKGLSAPRLRRSWGLAVLLAAALFLLSNHLLIRGRARGIWDADGQFFPHQVLVADSARAGRLFYWDPWSNAGLPVFGDPQVGLLSPVNLGLGLLTGGTSTGFVLYWLAMWWLGGLGMLLFARHLGAPPWGGLAVALGFLFCGVYTGNAEHTSWITGFSFLPLVLWRLDVALCARALRPAVEAGALWGLSALAGYPGFTILTGGLATLWALGRWLCGGCPAPGGAERRPALLPVLAALALVLLVGVLVLWPVYFAFLYEGAGTHGRAGPLPRETAVGGNPLPPGAMATLASPYLVRLKLLHRRDLWPATDVSMCSLYLGAAVPALALTALLHRPRDRWRWWLAGLALLALAAALGPLLPLRGWLYDWVYPTRFFRQTAIFRAYVLFLLAVLALLGTRDLAAGRARGRFLAASVGTAAAALAVFLAFRASGWNRGASATAFAVGCLHAGWAWPGLCLAALAWHRRAAGALAPVLLAAVALGDAFLTGALSRVTMIDVYDTGRWRDLDRRHSASLELRSFRREPCATLPRNEPCTRMSMDQLVTKVPVFHSAATADNDFHLAMVGHPVLLGAAVGTERLWFSAEVARVAPTEEAFAAFRTRSEALGAVPLVLHSPERMLDPRGEGPDGSREIGRLPPARRLPARLLAYRPDELSFEAEAPADGWLLITDRWARSWRAEVNGRPSPLQGANFLFRAVPVSAGRNRVRLTYEPFGFPGWIAMSWVTLAGVALMSLAAAWRSRGAAE